jgi:hypothetical protein
MTMVHTSGGGPRRPGCNDDAMDAAPAPVPPDAGSVVVRLPPMYVLRRHHVLDALKGVPADATDVEVWIDISINTPNC